MANDNLLVSCEMLTIVEQCAWCLTFQGFPKKR